MSSQSPGPERNDSSMFGTLVASRPGRPGREVVESTIGSVAAHALLIAILVYATSNVSATPAPEDPTRVISLAPAPAPVTPPPPMEAQAPPTGAPAPTGFPAPAMPDVVPPVVPPPQIGVTMSTDVFRNRPGTSDDPTRGDTTPPGEDGALGDAPFVVPMDLKPRLRNLDEVQRSVSRNYPPMLRDAGIGGTTVMWFYIDETGRVAKHQVHQSSDHPALDSAAARVADVMRFHPAETQGRKIPVWVQVPVVFRIQ